MIFSKSVIINAPIDKVFSFCASADGFEQHFPQPIDWLDKGEPWQQGSIFRFKYRFLFTWWYWEGEITNYEKNSYFIDILRTGGGLKYFQHKHKFEPCEQGTLYTDKIEFTLGFGSWIDQLIVNRIIGFIFAKRHRNLCKYFDNLK